MTWTPLSKIVSRLSIKPNQVGSEETPMEPKRTVTPQEETQPYGESCNMSPGDYIRTYIIPTVPKDSTPQTDWQRVEDLYNEFVHED